MRGKGRRWSGHDSGKWGRCLSSAAAGRPCDRLEVTVWVGRDGGEMVRGERLLADHDWREIAGTLYLGGWRVSCGRAPSGWEWNRSQRARARLNWVSQGQDAVADAG